jgi:hypothetical protein
MREYLGFLKCSSVVVKITAWIFLFFGGVGAISLLLGRMPGNPRWMGIVVLVFYMFVFFFFFLVAKIADILVKIISAGDACGGNAIHKD